MSYFLDYGLGYSELDEYYSEVEAEMMEEFDSWYEEAWREIAGVYDDPADLEYDYYTGFGREIAEELHDDYCDTDWDEEDDM